jgi:hypothetical protein
MPAAARRFRVQHAPRSRPLAGLSRSRGALLAGLLSATGCVERYLEIDTNPAGARLVVNGRALEQASPAVVPFTHYGTFRIDAWLPEQPAVTRFVELETPWWQWFPFDVITDLLSPFTHVDRRQTSLDLAAAKTERVTHGELLERADALRRETR